MVNNASDSETFHDIDRKPSEDQDNFRGSKFMLLCFVYGAVETTNAIDTDDGLEWLETKVLLSIAYQVSAADSFVCTGPGNPG